MRGQAVYLYQPKTSHRPDGRTMSQIAPVFKELTHDDLLRPPPSILPGEIGDLERIVRTEC